MKKRSRSRTSCAGPCSFSGKRASCAGPSSRFATKSRTGSLTMTIRFVAKCRAFIISSSANCRISKGRVAATLRQIDEHHPIRTRHLAMKPYRQAAELRRDLDIIDRSLRAHGSRILTRGRLRALRRAADCFGFHLASVDLRQNSNVHERTIAELFEAVAPGTNY